MSEIAINRFSGFSDLYNDVRPVPPEKVCKIIVDLLNKEKVDRIVDLGCGTGLATKIWKDYAKNVIGIEPNNDMRRSAEKANPDITFLNANSYCTLIENSSVEVVTCSQSFHWMEPFATLKEINRILRSKGMLAIYDCFWPVSISTKAEMAYNQLFSEVDALHETHKGTLPHERQWQKGKHFKNVASSNYFEYCKEMYFENTELCDAERFIGIALSQGHLQTLIKSGVQEIDGKIERFKEEVRKDIKATKNMYVSYKMIIGIKK